MVRSSRTEEPEKSRLYLGEPRLPGVRMVHRTSRSARAATDQLDQVEHDRTLHRHSPLHDVG